MELNEGKCNTQFVAESEYIESDEITIIISKGS